MQKRQKDLLRALVSALRARLVGKTSVSEDKVERGNLDRELERLGIAPDGSIKPIEALPGASEHERYAYGVVAAQISARPLAQRVEVRGEIIERAAYTWINRLLALRAMEVRKLIDNTLHGDEAYSGISEKLFLVRETQPERASGEDGGWWAVIEDACNEQAASLPGLFALDDPAAALRPGAGVLAQCITLVGGKLGGFTQEEADATFAEPDAIGWAYQFYQEESKGNIDAKCKSGGKVVSRSELAAKTQLFTEPYMVQWLLQNSLGRSYHEAYPQSTLPASWPYYVQPEHLETDTYFTLANLTLLDPCMGSGHFLRAAFDLFVAMYREQFPAWSAREIADRVLSEHLHGIDLDPRAAQLTALTLYLRAWELVRDEHTQQHRSGTLNYTPPMMNLATTPTNLNKGALARHLQRHPQDELFKPLIEEIFAGLEQAEILGSLLRPREYLDRAISELQKLPTIQRGLFSAPDEDELRIRIAAEAKNDPEGLKKLAMNRVIESFHAEAHNVNDVSAMLFGREAEQGVRLLQLLDRQYAVVVTNPPYMGSKYMDTTLRKYVEKHYKLGKRDLYTAFILRCRELCLSRGRMAMVTMQSWMFLSSFARLRATPKEELALKGHKSYFTGILRETSIDVLAQLGANAFEEIGGEVVQSTMFSIYIRKPHEDRNMIAFRLIGIKSPEGKSTALHQQQNKYTIFQDNFLSIPGTPIVYWPQQTFFELLRSARLLKNVVEIRQGLATTNDARYLRRIWEIDQFSRRWFPFSKGGGYRRWVGFENFIVDWQFNGLRIKQNIIVRYPYLKGKWEWVAKNSSYYVSSGLTYTAMASGSLALRLMPEGSICGHKGPGVFSQSIDLQQVAAICNTHIATYLMRIICPSLGFETGQIERLPIPITNITSQLTGLPFLLKEYLIFYEITESRYRLDKFANSLEERRNDFRTLFEMLLSTLEGCIEKIITAFYGVKEQEIAEIMLNTGTPAGWYPLITNYDALPTLPDDLDLPALPQELFDYLAAHERISPGAKELARIKANLRALYEAGSGAKHVEQEESSEVSEDDEQEEGLASGAHIPIPTETFLEELSVKMQVHPISVYWLLEELRAEGVRCKPEEKERLEDRLSVLVLRLLGHRWPTQIEAGEAVPAWAERGGIIPLLGGTGKATLAERVRERLREEDSDLGAQKTEALLEELSGWNLEEWLRRRFFARHVSQFKSRPVAWHLASTPAKVAGRSKKSAGGLQRRPAFECFLYYHACSTNALARVRNAFVEPLIQLERSKIERGKSESEEHQLFSDTDEASALASERIRELQTFANKLQAIEEQGFACADLSKLLADEGLDRWCGDGYLPPTSREELLRNEGAWHVDINDGVRVNIAPLQVADVLASNVLKLVDARKAIADRARWRADERRWVRAGKLPRCGWLDEQVPASPQWEALEPQRIAEQHKLEQKRLLLQQGQTVDEDAELLGEREEEGIS